MKIYKVALNLIIIAGITFGSACDGGSEGPSREQQFLERLSITWNLESAKVGGKDVSKSFEGLSLTLNSDKTYTVANPVSPIWTASGNFTLIEFPNSELYNIVRNDGTVITITELSETTLRYTFPYTSAGGRTNSVSGEYEFVMKK